MKLRPAGPPDLPALRALHLASWRAHYAGLFPEDFLANAAPVELDALWTAERLQSHLVPVAEDAGGLAGFAACDPGDAEGPFLDNIHVHASRMGQGVGRALMGWLAQTLRARGQDSLWLLVLDGNCAARAAYARLGGVEGPPQTFEVMGQPVLERPVRWPTLAPLLAPC